MPDYTKSKIYSIRSHQTDAIYIGSTTQPLSRRMMEHRRPSNRLTSNEITKYDDAYIELIEEYSCDNKEQLTAREQHHIRLTNCINKIIPGRTRKEHYDENKDKIQQYYQDNRERIRQRQKEYYARKRDAMKNIPTNKLSLPNIEDGANC